MQRRAGGRSGEQGQSLPASRQRQTRRMAAADQLGTRTLPPPPPRRRPHRQRARLIARTCTLDRTAHEPSIQPAPSSLGGARPCAGHLRLSNSRACGTANGGAQRSCIACVGAQRQRTGGAPPQGTRLASVAAASPAFAGPPSRRPSSSGAPPGLGARFAGCHRRRVARRRRRQRHPPLVPRACAAGAPALCCCAAQNAELRPRSRTARLAPLPAVPAGCTAAQRRASSTRLAAACSRNGRR